MVVNGGARVGDFTGCLAGSTFRWQLVSAYHQIYQVFCLRIQQHRATVSDHGPSARYFYAVTAFADGHFIRVFKQVASVYNTLAFKIQCGMEQDSVDENTKIATTEQTIACQLVQGIVSKARRAHP